MISTVQTTRYVLSQYREMPEAEQPYLELRYISRNERLQIEQHLRAADAADDEQYFEHLKRGITVALAGWGNYPVAYNGNPDDVLSDADYAEMRRALLPHIGASEIVKKNSWHMRQSMPVNSASENAAVTTVTDAQQPSNQ